MFSEKSKSLVVSFLSFSVLIWSGCPAGSAPNTNVNTNTNANLSANSNLNTVPINTNTNTTSSTSSSTIETKEPEKYTAVVKLKFETTGDSKATLPTALQANVAKNGADRRMEFNMPNGEKLIYLETGGKNLVLVPNRKQYAELNKESVGFDIRSLMTPDQIVNQVKNQKGVERVGEEKFNNRDAVKYQYSAVTDTKTTAGNVETKSFIYVDKETSLPLYSETTSASMNGNVQGIQGVKIITEMTDIKTDVDTAMFTQPADYAQVDPNQVKGQIDLVFRVATGFIEQLMKQAPQATTTASPAAANSPR